MSNSVVVRVPASTSNCGPGFDTLGIALNLYGTVRVSTRSDNRIVYAGSDTSFPGAAVEMVEEVVRVFANVTGETSPGIDFDIQSDVPIARGLGSSVILRAGILAALNHLADSPLSDDQQVEQISLIEGHPDNASAAVFGGFTVARFCPEQNIYFGTQRFQVSEDLAFVVVAPKLEIKTDESRQSLPRQIEFSKVVSSLNSLAYLVAAFSSGDYDSLRHCRVDYLHEPYRLKSIPNGRNAIEAGIEAGAMTGWLSGSGSSVLCLATKSKGEAVRMAMEAGFRRLSTDYNSFVLAADNAGLTIEN